MGSKETQARLTGHTSNIMLLLLLIAISLSSYQAEQLLEQCRDVAGRTHKLGDSYIGPDNCNTCICKEAGNACTRKICPVDATPRNAEADKCVDKDGILHKVGESYTHVDGCNNCRCTEHGGACTKKFCIQQDVRDFTACVDPTGKERTVGDSWLDRCNKCLCGPLGAVCTEKFCGDHIQFDDADAKIDEIVNAEGGSIVDESGDQPCRDHNNESRNPGDTWLTEDSCNICSCKGDGSLPTCSKMGCRARMAIAKLVNADSGTSSYGSDLAMALITLLAIKILA